jgi:hypothetical protein
MVVSAYEFAGDAFASLAFNQPDEMPEMGVTRGRDGAMRRWRRENGGDGTTSQTDERHERRWLQ